MSQAVIILASQDPEETKPKQPGMGEEWEVRWRSPWWVQ